MAARKIKILLIVILFALSSSCTNIFLWDRPNNDIQYLSREVKRNG